MLVIRHNDFTVLGVSGSKHRSFPLFGAERQILFGFDVSVFTVYGIRRNIVVPIPSLFNPVPLLLSSAVINIGKRDAVCERSFVYKSYILAEFNAR